jgi:hypothetical protein
MFPFLSRFKNYWRNIFIYNNLWQLISQRPLLDLLPAIAAESDISRWRLQRSYRWRGAAMSVVRIAPGGAALALDSTLASQRGRASPDPAPVDARMGRGVGAAIASPAT